MDAYAYDTGSPRRSRSATFFGCLTVITLLCVLCVAGVSVAIFVDPNLPLNPFPPPTLPALAALPTETPTNVIFTLPASWTPTNTVEPTLTETIQPTSTLPPTPTPVTLTATPTETPTPPPDGYPFIVRQGNPKAIPNIYHPELGCEWMGVGGQVVDMSNTPVIGLIIRLGGRAAGISVADDVFSLTGLALSYGRSGYEFQLADRPVPSRGQLWVQLVSQAGGPLSDRVVFDTYDNCEQNLIIIDFVQVRK